jgi:hypothetical protein
MEVTPCTLFVFGYCTWHHHLASKGPPYLNSLVIDFFLPGLESMLCYFHKSQQRENPIHMEHSGCMWRQSKQLKGHVNYENWPIFYWQLSPSSITYWTSPSTSNVFMSPYSVTDVAWTICTINLVSHMLLYREWHDFSKWVQWIYWWHQHTCNFSSKPWQRSSLMSCDSNWQPNYRY